MARKCVAQITQKNRTREQEKKKEKKREEGLGGTRGQLRLSTVREGRKKRRVEPDKKCLGECENVCFSSSAFFFWL